MSNSALLAATRRRSSYLLEEDFETNYSGPPPGWSGTLSFYVTTSPLRGVASMAATNTNQSASVPFTSSSEVWVFTMLNPTGGNFLGELIELRDGSDANLIFFGIWGAANLRLRGGGKDEFPAFSIDFNTTYYVWIRYVAGSGSNSLAEFYVSTTATKPGTPTYSWSNGNSTTSASKLAFSGGGGGFGKWDYIRVSATSIGSDPT